jgi:ketosteroid isomerase-like protein
MNDQEQIELVKKAYSLFKSGDIESLLNLMSEDINWVFPDIENVPFSGKRHGKQAVREFFKTLASEQDVIEFNPIDFFARGDKVVCLGHYEWKTREGGQRYGSDWAHVFTIRDGKVNSFQEYADSAAAAKAFKHRIMAER